MARPVDRHAEQKVTKLSQEKENTTMSQLASVIEKAADAFAREIIAAVKGSTLQELLAMREVAAAAPGRKRGRPPKVKPGRKAGRPAKATATKNVKAKPGRKPGRPPKAKPGRKPGRPAKATSKKITKKAAKTSANKKRSINYPKCSVPGCGKNRYSKGNGMCGAHFKAAQAGARA